MTIKSNKKINENSTKCEFAFTDVLLQFKTLCPIFVYRKTLKRVETNSLIGIRSFSPVGNFVLLRVGLLNKHQRGRSHLFRPVVAAVGSEREKRKFFNPKIREKMKFFSRRGRCRPNVRAPGADR